MGRFTAVHLEEIEEITDGRCPWRPVRHHLGIKSFGINAWTAREAGDRLINEHDEADTDDQQEELYFVHRGRVAICFGDGSEHELGPGGVARVSASTVRKLRNLSETEEAVYLIAGGKDGYVGRDGRLPEGEESRFGPGAPPGG